jgi:hypothetical protein
MFRGRPRLRRGRPFAPAPAQADFRSGSECKILSKKANFDPRAAHNPAVRPLNPSLPYPRMATADHRRDCRIAALARKGPMIADHLPNRAAKPEPLPGWPGTMALISIHARLRAIFR